MSAQSDGDLAELDDTRIQRILAPSQLRADKWRDALQRFHAGDATLTRQSAGEAAIRAVQRMLVFLGYSTSSNGAFVIDGDFGRGTNRGVAQFQFEKGIARRITRRTLCYPCTWQSARRYIVTVPEARLTRTTLKAMLKTALEMIDSGKLMCGDFDTALSFLDAIDRGQLLNCEQIFERYHPYVDAVVSRMHEERSIRIAPQWIYAIIRVETGGIVRPRFEQHVLSRLHRKHPKLDFTELRFRAMSQGLGQVLGENYRAVGARSAYDMYTSGLEEQVAFVARFLAARPAQVAKQRPKEQDFRAVARFYNGRGYEKHFYHERLERAFREFLKI